MKDPERREIALAWAEGRVYSTLDVPASLCISVFLPIAFMACNPKQRRLLKKAGAVIAIRGRHKMIPGRAVNGYPFFSECQILTKHELKTILAYRDEFAANRNAMLKGE